MAFFLHTRHTGVPEALPSPCNSFVWAVAFLIFPAIFALLPVLASCARRFRHRCLRKKPMRKCKRNCGTAVVLPQPPSASAITKAQQICSKPLALSPVPAAPDRNIDLHISARNGKTLCVTIDHLSPGGALLKRALVCLGADEGNLVLPNGEPLNSCQALSHQGLSSGDALTTSAQPKLDTSISFTRCCFPICHFNSWEHLGNDDYFSRFYVEITLRSEPEMIQQVHSDNVHFEATEYSMSLVVTGAEADYTLRRTVTTQPSRKSDNLYTGFRLCPERCSVHVVPQRRIKITLRPVPNDWLEKGSRVIICKLSETVDLNGQHGTVLGYCQNMSTEVPRYIVKLDGSRLLKKVRRKNLELEAGSLVQNQHDADEAAGGLCPVQAGSKGELPFQSTAAASESIQEAEYHNLHELQQMPDANVD